MKQFHTNIAIGCDMDTAMFFLDWIGVNWWIIYLTIGTCWGMGLALQLCYEDWKMGRPVFDCETIFKGIPMVVGVSAISWPMYICAGAMDRPWYIIALVATVCFYFFRGKEHIPGWILAGIVLGLFLLADIQSRKKWEPTGDDVFPHRRRGPF